MWNYFHLCQPAALNKYIGKTFTVRTHECKVGHYSSKDEKGFVTGTQQFGVMNELAMVNVIYSSGKWEPTVQTTRSNSQRNMFQSGSCQQRYGSRAIAMYFGVGSNEREMEYVA